MADDLWTVLTRFHREVVVPDLERIVDERLDERINPLRREMLAGFDAIYKRLDRLESEYQALRAGVQRVEERLAAFEQKIDRMALRSELLELKERVALREQKIAEIETDL
jgi:chromosome segregation ATPase